MTQRYKIADRLNKEIAAAVVRHDEWKPSRSSIGSLPHPRTSYDLAAPDDQGESEDFCPLGLYLYFDPDVADARKDTMLTPLSIPATGTYFAAFALGADVAFDDDWQIERIDLPTDKLDEFDVIARDAQVFMDAWDRGLIPVEDLDIAWGLREP